MHVATGDDLSGVGFSNTALFCRALILIATPGFVIFNRRVQFVDFLVKDVDLRCAFKVALRSACALVLNDVFAGGLYYLGTKVLIGVAQLSRRDADVALGFDSGAGVLK